MQDERRSSQSSKKSEPENLSGRLEKLQLTAKQLRFVCAYVMNGGNGTQAAIIAGYSATSARQRAHELVTNSDIQRALAELTMDDVYTTKGLASIMGSHAMEADIADFEPYLDGEMSLRELREAGTRTKLLRKVTKRTRTRTETSKDGVTVTTTDEVRGIELYDAQAAARDLLRMRAAAGEDSAGEPKAAPPVVNVTLMRDLRRQLVKAHDEPFVPGIPRLDGGRALPAGDGKGSGDDDNGNGNARETE